MVPLIITGKVVDCFAKETYPAQIFILDGRISAIKRLLDASSHEGIPYILPGFVDAHIHIESSMLIPSEFARLAVVHGTVATVSDPHEIANVCGMDGVNFMIDNGLLTPFKFYFGAPSCVPATTFETAGAQLDSDDVERLLDRPEVKYLSEMMNFPGALHGDPEVLKKIEAALKRGKPVDGHAPGLRGEDARRYIARGISTDHECFTREEALDKLEAGMKIIIREGSAAKNFDALIDLLQDHPDSMMFCSDDKHPDSLVEGHINTLCARAVAKGIDLFKVLKAACINPVLHYGLEVGLLRVGDPADFVMVRDLVDFEVAETWIDGRCVAREGISLIESNASAHDGGNGQPKNAGTPVNNFSCRPRTAEDIAFPANGSVISAHPVIEAFDGQLITGRLDLCPTLENDHWVSDPSRDILKIIVVNRYHEAPVAKAFIRNFGLKEGAMASSVAHDSHNIVAVGADDESLCRAVNLVIAHRGGVGFAGGQTEMVVPLPVAGLMSMDDGYLVAEQYTKIDKAAKNAGSTLAAPYMTLSFMALLVIPHLKLSDLGLFDGDQFGMIDNA